MAPDLVPKSGTQIGAAFYDVSTTLDCKRGRLSEPDSVPNSGLNSGLVSVRFDTLSPQILYSVLKPFCNVFWIVPHPRFVSPLQPSLLRLALRHTMPHNTPQQVPQPCGAEGSFEKPCRLAALKIVPPLWKNIEQVSTRKKNQVLKSGAMWSKPLKTNLIPHTDTISKLSSSAILFQVSHHFVLSTVK